jgi:hypothetical protein
MMVNFEDSVHRDLETKNVVLHLKVPLTDQQKCVLSDEIAQAIEEMREAQSELKFISSEINGRIKAADAKVQTMANKIRSGYEIKEMKCLQMLDFSNGTVSVRRLDTGELVSERAMTVEERQPTLPLAHSKENENVQDPSDGAGESV